jgi:AraC-like DNA-binding protein
MRYAEHPPPPALAPYVRCVWVFEADRAESGHRERIVPDGRCELVVHVGDAFLETGPDREERVQPRTLFAGQLSRPLWLRAAGRAEVIGVRFHPAAARSFLGLPLTTATDRRLDLRAVCLEETRALHRALEAANDRRASVERFVAQRIERLGIARDGIVEACAARFEATQGRASIEALVADAGIGRRQLERRFRDAVGLSPKRFAAVLRLRSVFDALSANPGAGWTDAALAAGYFDQSHLIRDFRRFVGCSPAQFLAHQAGLGVAIVQAPAGTAA